MDTIKKLDGDARIKQLEKALSMALSYVGKALNDSNVLDNCVVSGRKAFNGLTSILNQVEYKEIFKE